MTAAAILLEGGRAAMGLADLVERDPRSSRRSGQRPLPKALNAVLGLRQIAQAALSVRAGTSGHAIGGAVDGVHALSMALLALLSRGYRRAAIRQVVLAGSLSLLELVDARAERP